MNIKSRLQKIEQAAGIYEKFCVCLHTAKTEIVLRSDGVDTVENPISDYCARCKKPIDKQIIIFQGVAGREWTGE